MNDTTSPFSHLLTMLCDLLGTQALSLDNLALFWPGFVTTVQLTFVSLLLGLMLALSFALIRALRTPLLYYPVMIITYLFRSTPLLIQLYLIYYGLGQIGIDSALWRNLISSPFWMAIIAFMLNTAAYTTEIIYGAIKTTSKGEIEAALAYGMSRLQAMHRIVLPSAFRRALPAYGNEVIFMLHATAIAGAVTLTDITATATQIMFATLDGLTPYMIAALFYMALSFALQGLFKLLERRLLAYNRPLR